MKKVLSSRLLNLLRKRYVALVEISFPYRLEKLLQSHCLGIAIWKFHDTKELFELYLLTVVFVNKFDHHSYFELCVGKS